MKPSLLDYLVCPRCRQSLRLEDATYENAEIMDGTLRCQGCNAAYSIREGVPILLPNPEQTDITQIAFGRQWQVQAEGGFEQETIYGKTPQEELADFERIFENTLQADSLILDAGCGSGRLVQSIAEAHPQAVVVGLDFSTAAWVAYKRTRHLANAHVIQGDLLHPPLRDASMSHIFSEGVLHHTPDTHQAFNSLPRLLRPEGMIYIWIYSNRFHPYRLVRSLFGWAYRLPERFRYILSHILALGLFPVLWLADRLRSKPTGLHFRRVVFGIYDTLAPQYNHSHAPEVVEGWFRENGLSDLQRFSPPVGLRGTLP